MSYTAFRSFLSYFSPAARRPEYIQAAALCLRDGADGPEVLLVTSLRTRRWIVPKGWPMKGRTLAQAAEIEAWEEAGVRGQIDPEEIGAYSYEKILKTGLPVPCRCSVFRLSVLELADDWPEKRRRTRRWVPLSQAQRMVDEPELQALFAQLQSNR